MKILITFIALSLSVCIFSQGKQYYAGTITAGSFIPIDVLRNRLDAGYNIGIDLEARNTRFAVYLNSRINFSKTGVTVQTFEYRLTDNSKVNTIIEVNVGPRWYLGDLKGFNGNIDLGFGFYTGSFATELYWGPQIGAGFSIPITPKLSAVLNSRFNIIGIDNGEPYLGIHAGLKYCFNK